MLIHAKSDYAIRALLVLADSVPELVKLDVLVEQQAMPRAFLEVILGELRRAGMVRSRRGPDGGWTMSMPADRITIGEVIRVVDGPLGLPPEPAFTSVAPGNPARHLPMIWRALSACATTSASGGMWSSHSMRVARGPMTRSASA